MCTHIVDYWLIVLRLIQVVVATLSVCTLCAAQSGLPSLPNLGGATPHPQNGFVYTRPTATEWFTRAPHNLVQLGREVVAPDNAWPLVGLTAGTALLMKYDQAILDTSQRLAKHWGLIAPPHVTGREYYYLYSTEIEGIPLPVYVPTNVNSAWYYLGDGYTQLMIVGSFFSYGVFTQDNRALQTASLTVESLLTTGIVVQILKRTTGRESPYYATQPGGRWDFFPNQKSYNYQTPKYDAFPSGHMATAMAATTVIAANYPEYVWIKPVGYTAMTLLGFAMLNNGVHWASEIPVSIALGYTAAKISLARVPRITVASRAANSRFTWYASPIMSADVAGIFWGARF
ncbi:MAG: phosphatase PAP2 family protein [Pseudomonadota bacterium]